MIPQVIPSQSGTRIRRIESEAERGTHIIRLEGSDGNILSGARLGVDGTASASFSSSALESLGAGPVTLSAISPVVNVTNEQYVQHIEITYSGSAGSVTQEYVRAFDPGSHWLAPNNDTMQALGAGPITVDSVIRRFGEDEFDLPYRVAEVTSGAIETGSELWVTDGTESGTALLADINPGVYSSEIRDFVRLDNGRVLFTATDGPRRGSDPLAADLWVTDGTSPGTMKLADAIGTIRVLHDAPVAGPAGSRLLLQGTRDNRVWATDGTPDGTEMLIDVQSSAGTHSLADGRVLARFFGGAGRPSELWITDGTGEGTVKITEDQVIPDDYALLDRNTLIARIEASHNEFPEYGYEPFAYDLAEGGVTLLADIRPGPEHSSPRDFILALPLSERQPESTLFDTRVTPLGAEEDSFGLQDHFVDPEGLALSFYVADLPTGASFDAASATISAAPDAEPGRHEVTVIAESSLGGTETDSFAWDLVDTGLLQLDATGAWGRETRESPITLESGSTLHIGRKDGSERLLRIEEARASIEDGLLSVDGLIHAEPYATELPLMEGGFTIDMASLTVTGFEDRAIEDSHRLVGDLIEMTFSDIALRPGEVVLRTDLIFGDAFTAFSTQGGPLALHLDAAGPSFGLSELGTGRWFTSDAVELPLPEGAPFSVAFSDLGLSYDFLNESVYLSGKAALTWGEKIASQFSFLSDSTTSKLTLDLAGEADDPFQRGDRFLRIGRDAEGWNWDIVGEIKYEGQKGGTPAKGRPFIEEMTFSLDTVEQAFGGGFKGTLPFLFKGLTLDAEIGATWDPAAIDSFAFGLDGLNAPLGATGLFVQGGRLAAENLATQEPDDWPVVSAQVDMTLGPHTDVVVSPVRGFVGGDLAGAAVTLNFEAGTRVEYLLPSQIERIAAPMTRWLGVDPEQVLGFELMRLNGDVAVDFARPQFSAGVQALFLDGIIQGQARLSGQNVEDVSHIQASISATATFPDALPLIGGLSRAGDGLAVFSADGDNSNDFAAAWTSFTIRFYGTTSVGLRFWLDGRYEVLGRRDIEALGSWELGPELELVILSAQWENASDSARLELIAPDGTVLTEADFGEDTGLAAGIALVDDLNSPTGRHVALLAPAAGLWDMRLVDEAGLGTVRYEASEMLQGAQATISDVTIAPGAREGVIALDLDPGDAEEIALTLFVSETPDALSGLNVIEATVPANAAGALSFDWDFAALASGTWWLHARAEGDGLVPQVAMFATPIEVTGAADLAVSLDQQAATGGASVLSVTVANMGDIASGAGVLDLTVPEAVLNAPALPGADPLTQTASETPLQDLAPGDSVRLDFALPAGLGPMVQPVMAEVSSPVFDADMENNSDALFLAALSAERGGVITTRGGAALAGVEVEAEMPDGSAITAQSGQDGGFSLAGLAPGAGMVSASYGFEPGQASITAGDALDALRIAVGLQPSFGPAGPMDYIAADVNRDGQVTAGDALDILRVAVGLPTPNAPQWLFLDAAADLSGITSGNVAYQPGIDLSRHPAEAPLDMTAILIGNMIEPV